MAAGAIGELNMVEAWWDRNDAIGAWQYSIPPDASPATHRLGSIPGPRAESPVRAGAAVPLAQLSRLRHGRGGRSVRASVFSGMHFITGAIGPTRVYATGGLRFWKDGRDVPDVMLGLYDYPKTDQHPAFNLALRVNFVDGAGESSGFRFVGSEGIMTVDGGVTVSKQPRQRRAGLHHRHVSRRPRRISFCASIARNIRCSAPTPIPCGRRARSVTSRRAATAITWIIIAIFWKQSASRKPVVEDATFGFRAAGPASAIERQLFRAAHVRVGSGDHDAERLSDATRSRTAGRAGGNQRDHAAGEADAGRRIRAVGNAGAAIVEERAARTWFSI